MPKKEIGEFINYFLNIVVTHLFETRKQLTSLDPHS